MRKTDNALISILGGLFFLSGMAALVYQVGWQRLLFAQLGVELATVTLVVAAFMLGLGIGGLVGGVMVDRFPSRAVALFAVAEAGVGGYGWVSPSLLSWAGDRLLDAPLNWLVLALFALLLPPTLLMGATLPILVTHVSRTWLHIGRTTGSFYAANTLGAALGSFLAGYLLFHYLEINEALHTAAAINLLVAIGAVVVVRWGERNA